MIEVDGSYEEGGGQIVRTALALSTLTGERVRVYNIRRGRSKPGLKAQHLTALDALKEICNAKISAYDLGTQEVTYEPGKIKKGVYEIDIGTAGSITLLLQALLLPCLFAEGKVTLNIKGGTCGKWQAPTEYFENVLLPHVRKFAEEIKFSLLKRGYYPKGGGEVKVEIWPKKKSNLKPISLTEKGDLSQIKGVSHASKDLEERGVAERQKEKAEALLKRLKVPIDIRVEYQETLSTGSGITLWALYQKDGEIDFTNPIVLGADALGERGKKAEKVGEEAALSLIKEVKSDGEVDKHLADQILPFMALLPGSKVGVTEVSKHCLSNIYTIEKLLPVKFKIKDNIISL